MFDYYTVGLFARLRTPYEYHTVSLLQRLHSTVVSPSQVLHIANQDPFLKYCVCDRQHLDWGGDQNKNHYDATETQLPRRDSWGILGSPAAFLLYRFFMSIDPVDLVCVRSIPILTPFRASASVGPPTLSNQSPPGVRTLSEYDGQAIASHWEMPMVSRDHTSRAVLARYHIGILSPNWTWPALRQDADTSQASATLSGQFGKLIEISRGGVP